MRIRPLLIATCLFCSLSVVAWAQRGPKTETLSGKVKEIQEKGRLSTLVVITDDGQELEFPLTPKVQFEVTAAGDQGFVRPGVYITAEGVLTNEQLFVKDLAVYIVGPGQRIPAGKVVKSQQQANASVNSYGISGTVQGRQSSPDYPDYEQLALKIAGRIPPIMLEKDFQVTVIARTPKLAQPDAPVELQVIPLRGDKFNLVKATVKLGEPLTAAAVFGDGGEGQPAAGGQNDAPAGAKPGSGDKP